MLADGAYKLIDTITTVIEIPTVNAVPDMGEKLDYDMVRAGYEYDWVYDHTSHGDTTIENKTIVSITRVLGALFGGSANIFMEVAATILDLGLDTVYYTIVVYKDRNDTSMLRPNFKWEIHLYSDAYRTEELDGSPIIKIIDE